MTSSGKARSVRQERLDPRAEIEEVATGVLRLQLPISLPGLGHVNCYILEDKHGLALVDPGLPGFRTWRTLKTKLKSAGFSIERVHTVIVTHSHPDHFGQAVRLHRETGAEIVTHRRFRTILDPLTEDDDHDLVDRSADDVDVDDDDRDKHPYQRRRTPWGDSRPALPRRYRWTYTLGRRFMKIPRPTQRVEDAEVLSVGDREWVAVHTPGHTEDHLCLWQPNDGIMISGDHVLPTITPHISGYTTSNDPLADFFTSLDRMNEFNGVKTVLPAHGLVFGDLCGRTDSITRHHLERLETLCEAGEDLGSGTVEQYMQRLFREPSWGHMAASETYAHLRHLVLTDQAKQHAESGQLRFTILD